MNFVPEYRAYIVGADGHFIKFVGLNCPNDEVAINHARPFVDGHDVELWSGDRPVIKLFSRTRRMSGSVLA